MILPSILGISWASTVISLMEHGMVMEGESIQTASAKSIIPFDHSSMMSSFRSSSLKGSGGEAIFAEMNRTRASSLRMGRGRDGAPPLDFPGKS